MAKLTLSPAATLTALKDSTGRFSTSPGVASSSSDVKPGLVVSRPSAALSLMLHARGDERRQNEIRGEKRHNARGKSAHPQDQTRPTPSTASVCIPPHTRSATPPSQPSSASSTLRTKPMCRRGRVISSSALGSSTPRPFCPMSPVPNTKIARGASVGAGRGARSSRDGNDACEGNGSKRDGSAFRPLMMAFGFLGAALIARCCVRVDPPATTFLRGVLLDGALRFLRDDDAVPSSSSLLSSSSS